MAKISTNLIKTLKYNGGTQRIWDDTLKGFGIRVQQNSMSFIICYRNQYGQKKYYTIGKVGVLTADEARRIAREKLAGIVNNADPANERMADKQTMTVAGLCDWYLKTQTHNKKPTTIYSNKNSIENHIKPLIGHIPIKALNRATIDTMVYDIQSGEKIQKRIKTNKLRGITIVKGGTFAAARALETLHAIFERAIQYDLIEKNPAHGIKKTPNNKSDAFMTSDEIRVFGQLLSDQKFYSIHTHSVNAIKLLLLTGCRKSEILGLKWEYINFDEQYFDFPDTKTGAQKRPFGAGALQFLKALYETRDKHSPYVFPANSESGHIMSINKTFKAVIESNNPTVTDVSFNQNLTIHSLRHTFASMGESLKYSPLIIAGLLGHKTNSVGVTGRYIHVVDKSLISAADDISNKIYSMISDNIIQKQ